MELTIIIVNWNGGELLRRCLHSIHQRVNPAFAQVLVVDNNSADGSREMAQREFPGMQVINSGGNRGFGKANNLARNRITTPFALFLNPDTEILDGCLPSMVSFMRAHPEIGAMGCKLREADGAPHDLPLQWSPSPWTQFLHLTLAASNTPSFVRKLLPYADPGRSGFVTKLCGGCILARKTALDNVGWFDERYFMYAEDIDLCHTLLQKGWKLYYLSDAEVFHAGGGTSRKTRKEFATLMMCESICQLMRKYYGHLGALMYRSAVMISCQIRLALLLAIKALALIWPGARRFNFADSWFKYRVMILWCLKLRRPMIPDRSC
jgi:N-acetylglucosaminyl-diphospho-decaprenol L-rhamnosyltransferase